MRVSLRWTGALLIGLGLLPLLGMAPPVAPEAAECRLADPEPPKYYVIDLVSTKKVPGTRQATGVGEMTFVPSPFGISVSPSGHYTYNLRVRIDKLRAPRQGEYIVWLTTPDLSHIEPLGPLDENGELRGQVTLNKFLVVVTLEPSKVAHGPTWQGPIVLRGLSRSGLMHTMAGHGPFQDEPCTFYGYN